jgi:hypothetical protein
MPALASSHMYVVVIVYANKQKIVGLNPARVNGL